MPDTREKRRLAAVLAADVVGYSRLMEADEAGTLERLKAARRDVVEAAVAEYGGRIVKTTGDGVLVEFPSAVDAVRCALAIQEAMSGRDGNAPPANGNLQFRVGVHLGDLIIDEDDIYGDGVNMAARLEGLAAPGGVAISGSVHEQVGGKIKADFVDAGEQHVKNISRAVRVWLWQPGDAEPVGAARDRSRSGPGIGRKPLVAVIRFSTTGNAPEIEDLVELLADELTSAFSVRRGIDVVARGATAGFVGAARDLSAVRELTGADYIVTGTLRCSGQRVRVLAEMIDAESGAQVWSSRYDRELGDVFDLGDELTDRIALASRAAMNAHEGLRHHDRPVSELTDAERRARAAAHFFRATEADFREAERILDTVLERTPDDAMALSMRAFGITFRGFFDIQKLDPETARRALDMAARAVRLDRNSDYSFETRGLLALHLRADCKAALEDAERSLALNPQYGLALQLRGEALTYSGRPEEAIPILQKVIDYETRDPLNDVRYWMLAMAYYTAGRYAEALPAIERALSAEFRMPAFELAHAAILEESGRHDEAHDVMEGILSRWPDITLDTVRLPPYGDPALKDRYRDVLRRAGLPG